MQDLVAVDFVTPMRAFGITGTRASCVASSSPTMGTEMGTEPMTLRLVVSDDGGATWRASGSRPPVAGQNGPMNSTVECTTGNRCFLAANGTLVATTSAGQRWSTVRLGHPVVTLARIGSVIYAGTSGDWRAWRDSGSADAFVPGAPLPTPSNGTYWTFTVGPGPMDVVAQPNAGDSPSSLMLSSSDGAMTWRSIPNPCIGQGPPGQVAALDSGQLAMICIGGAAAGSEDKSFFVSSAARNSWVRRAALRSLDGPNPSHIPSEDYGALAAPFLDEVLMATTDRLAISTDGGGHWSDTTGSASFDGGGFLATFHFFGHAGVVFVPRVGLWHSVDGHSWAPA